MSENAQHAAGNAQHAERNAQHVAMYAGSFDPITLGHLDVLRRARRLFDQIVLGIGHNPGKQSLFGFDERVEMAQVLVSRLVEEEPDGASVSVRHYTGLTVDVARSMGACALLRGIRNLTDLTAEMQLALTNRQVADIETVFIVTGEAFAFTSSSLIRQIAAMGGSLERLRHIVPELVIERLEQLRSDPNNVLRSLVRDQSID
ncbi:MAG: pantetheine-phosphate adenylyltransferase [Planctomycetota bacterium]|jgi:pantetheine-phosphate adenylyltransferase